MKRIAITMGDPGGVGPAIIVGALCSDEVRGSCLPVVIGSRSVMEEALRFAGTGAVLNIIKTPAGASPEEGLINMIDEGGSGPFAKGKATPEGGAACAGYIKKAVELALAGTVSGIVTAPISKEALKLAGLPWPGHTEMLAELTTTDHYAMMLAGGPLKVILATIHTAIRNVPDMITRDRVLKTLRLARKACDMMGMSTPRIAVAGLNPHAGEAGIFGDEEIRAITPAVEDARREGISATGPLPPDTVFHRAFKGEFDIIVCMYHDQGLIPLKMIAFDTGVNVTVGLPLIRTSPDHGTAYDIAWKGKADHRSLCEAIRFALSLRI